MLSGEEGKIMRFLLLSLFIACTASKVEESDSGPNGLDPTEDTTEDTPQADSDGGGDDGGNDGGNEGNDNGGSDDEGDANDDCESEFGTFEGQIFF